MVHSWNGFFFVDLKANRFFKKHTILNIRMRLFLPTCESHPKNRKKSARIGWFCCWSWQFGGAFDVHNLQGLKPWATATNFWGCTRLHLFSPVPWLKNDLQTWPMLTHPPKGDKKALFWEETIIVMFRCFNLSHWHRLSGDNWRHPVSRACISARSHSSPSGPMGQPWICWKSQSSICQRHFQMEVPQLPKEFFFLPPFGDPGASPAGGFVGDSCVFVSIVCAMILSDTQHATINCTNFANLQTTKET